MSPPAVTPIPWLGHAIEVASLVLVGWCWVGARRQGRGIHVELVVAAMYGWMLEELDMRIFGTYHYHPVTWWWIGHVPLYIPLLWAAIIHSAMALSDRAGLPERVRPFLDGLLAVLIDLAVDAIAIRVGLWSWRIRLTEGWFGVPAGNLCAWMWVAAWYGWTTRLVRRRIQQGQPRWHRLLVPVVAYTGLFSALFLIGATGRWLGLETQNARLWMFAAHVAGFLLIVVFAPRAVTDAPRVPTSFAAARGLIHGSFVVLLWTSGIWRSVPALVLVSSASFLGEWWVQRWCGHPSFGQAPRRAVPVGISRE